MMAVRGTVLCSGAQVTKDNGVAANLCPTLVSLDGHERPLDRVDGGVDGDVGLAVS